MTSVEQDFRLVQYSAAAEIIRRFEPARLTFAAFECPTLPVPVGFCDTHDPDQSKQPESWMTDALDPPVAVRVMLGVSEPDMEKLEFGDGDSVLLLVDGSWRANGVRLYAPSTQPLSSLVSH